MLLGVDLPLCRVVIPGCIPHGQRLFDLLLELGILLVDQKNLIH
jgi:hypothetical protein